MSDTKLAKWLPAVIACVAFSVGSNFTIVKSIGADILVSKVPMKVASRAGESATFVGLYAGRTILMIIGLLTFSILTWFVLRLVSRSWLAASSVNYGTVLVVCAYAGCGREAIRLIVTIAITMWHSAAGPMASAQDIKTNAAAFLPVTASRPLFALAQSLDALMFGFFVLVTVGLWKSIPGLPLKRAAAVACVSWLTYSGLVLLVSL